MYEASSSKSRMEGSEHEERQGQEALLMHLASPLRSPQHAAGPRRRSPLLPAREEDEGDVGRQAGRQPHEGEEEGRQFAYSVLSAYENTDEEGATE